MKKIRPFLWFNDNAEEATNFYVSIFKNSKILSVSRRGGGGPDSKSTVMSTTFELDGQEYFALNGGPYYKLNPAFSLFVNCENQQEVDDLWEKLSQGGEPLRCGWLTDRFGVTWQIVPTVLVEMLQDEDPERSRRVSQAMMKMIKLDIAELKQAYENA